MKLFRWIKCRISHKLSHLRMSTLVDILKENGMALVVIIVLWEIIEDILFPVLFILLGKYVHPAFLAGAPISWLLCLHWLAVPVLWSAWVKFNKLKSKNNVDYNHGKCKEQDSINS